MPLFRYYNYKPNNLHRISRLLPPLLQIPFIFNGVAWTYLKACCGTFAMLGLINRLVTHICGWVLIRLNNKFENTGLFKLSHLFTSVCGDVRPTYCVALGLTSRDVTRKSVKSLLIIHAQSVLKNFVKVKILKPYYYCSIISHITTEFWDLL